jgi:hypothetical protein
LVPGPVPNAGVLMKQRLVAHMSRAIIRPAKYL